MANNFRSYRDESDKRKLKIAAALGVTAVALSSSKIRQTIVQQGLKGLAALSSRFIKDPSSYPTKIEAFAGQLENLLEKGIPGAARSTFARRYAQNLLSSNYSKEEIRHLFASPGFTDLLEAKKVSTNEFLATRNIKLLLESRAKTAGGTFEEAMEAQREFLRKTLQQAQEQTMTYAQAGKLESVQSARQVATKLAQEHLQGHTKLGTRDKIADFLGLQRVRLRDLNNPAANDARAFLGGFVHNPEDLLVGGMYKFNGQIVDARGIKLVGERATEWVKDNLQIPLAPGGMGISPLQLFPWMHGNIKAEISHIPSKAIDVAMKAHLGSTGDRIGQDVYQIGKKIFAVDFMEDTAQILDVEGYTKSGIWGYAKRRTQEIDAALSSAPINPLKHPLAWLGIGRHAPAEVADLSAGQDSIGRVQSFFTKFGPESTWAPRLFDRILNTPVTELNSDDVRRAAGFLRTGNLSKNLRASLINDENLATLGKGVGDPLIGLVKNLDDESNVYKFFEIAARRTQSTLGGTKPFKSSKLNELVQQWISDPESLLGRYKPAMNRGVAGWNFAGEESPERALGLMRDAIFDEIEEGIVGAGGKSAFINQVKSSSIPEKEKLEALAYGYGKTTGRMLQQARVENEWLEAVKFFRQDPEAQEVIEQFTQSRAKWWHSHVEEESMPLHTSTLFMQKGVGPQEALAYFNKARAAGASMPEAIRDMVTKSKFTRQFGAFFTGDQKDVTDVTAFLEYFPRRINQIFEEVGLGLPEQDLKSGGSILGNILLKRVAPAYLGYEYGRYANYKSGNLFGEIASNLQRKAGILRASNFGDKIPFLGRRELFPGLNILIPERDVQEELEYQEEGFQEVRSGRYWNIGSRGQMRGDKVSYFLPTANRITASGWQDTENSGIGGHDYWSHSYLPTLENPLGPLGPGLWDPYWWERKYAEGEHPDRPYLISSRRFSNQSFLGPILNFLTGWTKPRKLLHPDVIPERLGGNASKEDLRRINESIKAGADDYGLDLILNEGAGGYAAGSGGSGKPAFSAGYNGRGDFFGSIGKVGPAGVLKMENLPGNSTEEEYQHLGKSSIQREGWGKRLSRAEMTRINKLAAAGGSMTSMKLMNLAGTTDVISEDDADLIDYENAFIAGARNLVHITGIYGYLFEAVLGDVKQGGIRIDDPSRATDFGHRFYEAEVGGLGMGASEAGRRFLTKREKAESYNPIRNTMPGWLPGPEFFLDLQHGDPFCLSENTLVETEKGFKKAKEVLTGDVILTHKGNRLPVKNTIIRPILHGEKSYRLKIANIDDSIPLEFSEEHPIYVKKMFRCSFGSNTLCRPDVRGDFCIGKNCKKSWEKTELEFIPCKDVQIGDAVVYPIPRSTELIKSLSYSYDWSDSPRGARYTVSGNITLDQETAWLLGVYLAEGSTAKQKGRPVRLLFSLNSKELELANKIVEVLKKLFNKKAKIEHKEGAIEVILCSSIAARIFDSLIPGNLYNKRIPIDIFKASDETRWSLLCGWLVGDGGTIRNFLVGTSAHKELIQDLYRLALSLGIPSRYVERKTRDVWELHIHSFNLRSRDLSLILHKKENLKIEFERQPNILSWSDENYIYSLVTGKEEIELEKVYGFEVDKDDSFCVFGFATHNTKIPKGALRLPGEAYESANPRVKLMQTRASALGKTVEEMMQGMLFLNAPTSDYLENIMEMGTEIHQRLQRRWKKMGVLVSAEGEVYNEQLGVKGHYDAILATTEGRKLVDIKTVSDKRFKEAQKRPFKEHVAQINFYLHETHIPKGQLIYINRDKPWEIAVQDLNYNPGIFNQSVNKVKEARRRLLGMVDEGVISRGDLYDPTTRLEILADVAPYSNEYAQVREYLAEQNKAGNLSPEDNRRFQAAKKRSATLKRRVDIYNYRFKDAEVLSRSVVVDKIIDANTISIAGSDNPIRLAGVRVSNERIFDAYGENIPEGMSPAEYLYARQGIRKGSRINVLLERDPELQIADDTMGTQHAVIMRGGRNINREFIDSGVGTEKETDYTSTGVFARFTEHERMIGNIWESISHLDNPITNKFLRVRSAREELERGVVFGKRTGGWENLIGDYISPTITSYMSKDPINAAFSMGVFAQWFTKTLEGKKKFFVGGAAIGAALSLGRLAYESYSGNTWKPARTTRREDLEEYWDILKYLKNESLSESYERLAKKEEHVDVDRMVREMEISGDKRKVKLRKLQEEKKQLQLHGKDNAETDAKIDALQQEINSLKNYKTMLRLGPKATKSLLFKDIAGSTLQGLEPGSSPFLNVIKAFPKYKRELIQHFVNSSEKDKKRIYDLLPRQEQRALGPYLGVKAENLPDKIDLDKYFRSHSLPGTNWKGWKENVSLEDLRIRAIKEERLDPMESAIFPMQIDEAEQRTQDIDVPVYDSPSHDIHGTLFKLLSGRLKNVVIQVNREANNKGYDDLDIDLRVRERKEQQIREALQYY